MLAKTFLQKASDFIGRHLESPLCLKCGSFQIQNSGFCASCEKNFLQPLFHFHRVKGHKAQNLLVLESSSALNLNVYSFVCWKKNASDSLSEWVYLLKNKTSQARWDWIARNISSDREIQELKLNQNSALIPIPGHRKSHHTKNFCKSLSQVFGCRVIENTFSLLHSDRQQKHLKRQERSNIELRLNEEITGLLAGAERLVLVDDIITTGATLNSAAQVLYRARINQDLQHSKQISCVTLFYRV